MSANPFLDDIREEAYQHALQSGNLVPKPREAPERFTLIEYRASLAEETCRCGKISLRLINIMACERGDKGSSTARALHLGSTLAFSQSIVKTTSVMRSAVNFCADCISQHQWNMS